MVRSLTGGTFASGARSVVAQLVLCVIGLGTSPNGPIRVFVTTSARGDEKIVEIIDEGRAEIEEKLRDKEDFVLVSELSEAELTIDLRAYWKRVRSTRVTVESLPVIEEYHHLLGAVTGLGLAREMTGIEIKKDRGSVEGAARDLVRQIERELRKRHPQRFR